MDGTIEGALLSANVIGSFGCESSGGEIKLLHTLTGDELEHVTMHEVGHALGLKHAGKEDSHDGSTSPVMATHLTLAEREAATEPRQDDHASLTNRRYSEDLHANSSFEDDEDFWYISTSNYNYYSSGGLDGYGKIHIGDTGAYMFQTVRIFEPGCVKARINYKRPYSAAVVGTVKAKLNYRPINFSGTEVCDTETKINNGCLNDADEGTGGFYYVGPETSWASGYTTWQTSKDTATLNLTSYEGSDVRIYVYNYTSMASGGGNATMAFDHTRARP